MVEFAIIGGAFTAMSQMTDYRPFVAFAALSQIGAGMMLPTLLTWAMSRLSFEVRGAGTGVWQSTFALGQFVVGLLVPFLAGLAGGIVPAFVYPGIASLVAAAISVIGVVVSRKKLQIA
jgi:MFS family permease